jgi:lysophospholipase L1-like esterase
VEKTNDINKLDIVIVDWVWLQLGLNDLLWRDHRVEETSDIEKLDIDQLIVLRCQL